MTLNRSILSFTLLAAVLGTAACEKTPSAPARPEGAPAARHAAAADPGHAAAYIQQANADLVRHFLAGDADAAAQAFTDDAVVMLAGMPAVTGRDAIRQMLAGMFQAVDFTDVQVRTLEVTVHGDMAYEMGTTVMTYDVGGTTVVEPGKYLVGWKRQPTGEWKVHRDISNPSR